MARMRLELNPGFPGVFLAELTPALLNSRGRQT